MVKGDKRTSAEAVAHKLGIIDVEADILPEDKNRIIRKLMAEGKVVAMAGDGVNDAGRGGRRIAIEPAPRAR
jgi:P-type Cu+ transporter